MVSSRSREWGHVMIKTIYAQTRHEGLSREDFVHLWRGHGALAMTLPGFWDPVVRYIQSDRLCDVSGFASARLDYVGVGELHYADVEGRRISKASDDLKSALLPDASRIFDRAHSINVGVEEIFLFRGRYAPVKIYAFVRRDASLSQRSFLARWEELQTGILRDAKSAHLVRRAVSGRALDEGADADCTLEFSFDTIADAQSFHLEWLSQIEAQASGIIERDRLVIIPAFVSLFYDRRLYAG